MRTTTRCILSTAALIALGACSATSNSAANQASYNDHTPGWTGTALVPGSNSTIAGDADATYIQQKWGVGRQR